MLIGSKAGVQGQHRLSSSLPAGWQRLVELGYAELRPIGSEKKA